MTFVTSCSFIAVDYFIECCRKVYFATEDYSIAIFIIVNVGMYYLFQEMSMTDNPQKEDNLKYYNLCRDNLETALSNWPLLQAPSKQMIEALLLGVCFRDSAPTSSCMLIVNRPRTRLRSPSSH